MTHINSKHVTHQVTCSHVTCSHVNKSHFFMLFLPPWPEPKNDRLVCHSRFWFGVKNGR